MSNQQIIWGMFIATWLSLLLVKKDELKRYMPAVLFTAFTSGLIYQLGIAAGFWTFREVTFPILMYGPLPVSAFWVLKFTYGRFWVYTITNAIFDLGFAFVLIPWFGQRGIMGVGTYTPVIVYGINYVHAALIYGYQKWQDWK